MNPDVTIEEIGLRQLCGVYEKVASFPADPVVVDADDMEDDPEGIIKSYCRKLNIPFIPESLTWDPGQKAEWEIWKDWHKDAAESTGIQKNMKTFAVTVENSGHLRGMYENQLPYYQKMYAQRVTL
jgi:hypothetical protein